jgi:hypothetical protein
MLQQRRHSRGASKPAALRRAAPVRQQRQQRPPGPHSRPAPPLPTLLPTPQFEAVLAEAGARLPRLERLSLAFNNAAQRLETRHLAAVAAAAPRLSALRLQADFAPDGGCDFGALAPLARLRELAITPSDAAGGLTDGHVASLAGLPPSLEALEFPGAARGFTGATLGRLAGLPALRRVAALAPKPAPAAPGAPQVEYTLGHEALSAVADLAGRRGAAAPPLALELGVPDAGWVPRLLAAGGPGLGRLAVTVREAAGPEALAALAAAPRARDAVVGLDLAFGGAPERADLDAIARLAALERLTITSKCVRPPSARLDAAAALAPLSRLRSLHLHINPQWRAPLIPEAVTGLAAALPALERLHLRLGAADHAAGGLGQLFRFGRLRALSLQWLGDDAAAPGPAGCRGSRRASLEAPVLQLGCLPRALEELSLTSISSVRLAPPAPFDPAFMSAHALGSLRSLALDGNFGLNDALLPALTAQLPALRGLALVLAGRQALTGEGLAAAVGALPQPGALASLLVTDYREGPLALDQGCLSGLAPALPRLRHLKLSTPDIVHAALRPEAFAAFTKLRRLDLVGCQELAAAALAGALPLCCCKPGPEWAGDAAAGGATPAPMAAEA